MGWHVHYRNGDRVGVHLLADREAALADASRLMDERWEVVRLLTHDRAETIDSEEIRALVAARHLPQTTAA